MIADNAAAESQHQSDGMIGDLAGAIVGRVANRNPCAGRRREVDMVVANARADDDAATPQGGNKGSVDLHLVPRDQGVTDTEGVVGQLAERMRAPDIQSTSPPAVWR